MFKKGVGKRVKVTDTIFFVDYDNIPSECRKDITYAHNMVDYCSQIDEPNRTQWTFGGNLIEYPGDVISPTSGTTIDKIACNSVVSTPKANYMCIDM